MGGVHAVLAEEHFILASSEPVLHRVNKVGIFLREELQLKVVRSHIKNFVLFVHLVITSTQSDRLSIFFKSFSK